MVVRSQLVAVVALTAASLAGAHCPAGFAEPLGVDTGAASVTCLAPLSGELKSALTGPASTEIPPAGTSAADVELLKAPARLAALPGTPLVTASGSTTDRSPGTRVQVGESLAADPSSPGFAPSAKDLFSAPVSTAERSASSSLTITSRAGTAEDGNFLASSSQDGSCRSANPIAPESAGPEALLFENMLRPPSVALPERQSHRACGARWLATAFGKAACCRRRLGPGNVGPASQSAGASSLCQRGSKLPYSRVSAHGASAVTACWLVSYCLVLVGMTTTLIALRWPRRHSA